MSIPDQILKPNIIVDLDSLFDTRLATLELVDPLLALHALDNGYNTREHDAFEFCDHETFAKLFAIRDTDTLAISMMTEVKNIVLDYAKDAIKEFNSKKTSIFPAIYINVYPYKIAKDAAGELLKPFYEALDGMVTVHMVNIPPSELTPSVCKKHFSYMIMYDYMAWLIAQGRMGYIQKNPMNEITLVAPRLYPNGKPPDEELDALGKDRMEPYQCTELYFAPFVKLEFYVSSMFSAVIMPEFIEKLKAQLTQ